MCKVELSCCGIRNCKRNPQTVSQIRILRVESANFFISIPVKHPTSISNPDKYTKLRSQLLTNIRNFNLISIPVKHTPLQSHFLQMLIRSQFLSSISTPVRLLISSFQAIQKNKSFYLAILKIFPNAKPALILIRQHFLHFSIVFLYLLFNSAVIQVLVNFI